MQGGVTGMEMAAAATALPVFSGTVFNKIGDGLRYFDIKNLKEINERRLEKSPNRPFEVKRDKSNDGVIDCGEYDSSEDECNRAGDGTKCKYVKGEPFNECLPKDYKYSTMGENLSKRELKAIRGRAGNRNLVDKANAELMGEGL